MSTRVKGKDILDGAAETGTFAYKKLLAEKNVPNNLSLKVACDALDTFAKIQPSFLEAVRVTLLKSSRFRAIFGGLIPSDKLLTAIIEEAYELATTEKRPLKKCLFEIAKRRV